MSRVLRFILALIVGLALLTWYASREMERTTEAWFQKDISLRARLLLGGSQQALVEKWREGRIGDLEQMLLGVARDERIMGAAAFAPDLSPVVTTPFFPADLSAAAIGAHVRPQSADGAAGWSEWEGKLALAGGAAWINAFPLMDKEQPLGVLVLAHDLSYLERRSQQMRRFLMLSFGVLVLAASATTIVAARLAWRGWSDDLRRILMGEFSRGAFPPILRDVRELMQRIDAERAADLEAKAWTPQRLKQTLNRYLRGERVVLLANREPYVHVRQPDGSIGIQHPASGLVTALEPVMRACSGVWVAHGSGSADRETVDKRDCVRVPPGEETYVLRRLWLSPEEERGYYYGFANEGLWPLCHIAHARPVFRIDDWAHYQAVNQRFADAVCEEVDSDDPIILVQDYHFALAPRLIRDRLPRSTILTFWHVPWPNAEHFGICPWREELLEGLLGSSILGFHTQRHCNNFMEAVDRFLEARIDREQQAVVQRGRRTLVRPYPISVEWPVRWLENVPPAAQCRAEVLAELGLPAGTRLGVGVDRLDYTKGIEERLLAVERLLERHPEYLGKFVFVQLASPSRTLIERYRLFGEGIEELVQRINARFGKEGWQPLILLRSHHEPPVVFRYLRAADLCYISSLHDGMNLVAKEFIAARDDEQGVLILSQFTGAAGELTEALVVNPYDLEEASEAMVTALRMSPEEQSNRMRFLRAFVAEFNVYRWAGRMIRDAAQLRRRERLADRLTQPLRAGARLFR